LTQLEQIYDGYSLTHKHQIRFVLFLEHFWLEVSNSKRLVR
jgi:hypothetical protein